MSLTKPAPEGCSEEKMFQKYPEKAIDEKFELLKKLFWNHFSPWMFVRIL